MAYKFKYEKVNEIIKQLSKEYDVYAPKRFLKQGRYSDTDIVRYDKIEKVEDIVFDEKSDYAAKEILSPITQSLFYFTEDEFRESKEKDKKILIFMRPCDINAMERQDRIYLQNGGFSDIYYKRMREKVKIALIECIEGWDTCFCVSMNCNKCNNYSIAIRNEVDSWIVDVKDKDLKEYFNGEEVDFQLKFIEENELKVNIPQIKNKTILTKLKEHKMWEEYNKRCISCGACTTSCSTCTCFTTTDIIYNENANVGERRRTTASCQVAGFDNMAGGHMFRTTAGDRMRYKVLHKFYDYKKRFKDYHMCTGCGRCIDRCPEFISIVATVEKMNNAILEIEKEEC